MNERIEQSEQNSTGKFKTDNDASTNFRTTNQYRR